MPPDTIKKPKKHLYVIPEENLGECPQHGFFINILGLLCPLPHFVPKEPDLPKPEESAYLETNG